MRLDGVQAWRWTCGVGFGTEKLRCFAKHETDVFLPWGIKRKNLGSTGERFGRKIRRRAGAKGFARRAYWRGFSEKTRGEKLARQGLAKGLEQGLGVDLSKMKKKLCNQFLQVSLCWGLISKKTHNPSDDLPTLPPYFELRHLQSFFKRLATLKNHSKQLRSGACHLSFDSGDSETYLTNGVGGRESKECDSSRHISSSHGLRQNGRRGPEVQRSKGRVHPPPSTFAQCANDTRFVNLSSARCSSPRACLPPPLRTADWDRGTCFVPSKCSHVTTHHVRTRARPTESCTREA